MGKHTGTSIEIYRFWVSKCNRGVHENTQGVDMLLTADEYYHVLVVVNGRVVALKGKIRKPW